MKIYLKSLLKQYNNILSFDLPNGDVLTASEDLDGNLLVDWRGHSNGDSFNALSLHGVMKPLAYDDGVYVITVDYGVYISNFKKAYNDYKETSKTGGYGQFYAVYKGSQEYLKGIIDAILLTDALDYIEVKDGKIIQTNYVNFNSRFSYS